MEWLEDNYDGEAWRFHSAVGKPAVTVNKSKAEVPGLDDSAAMVRILTNRLMEGKILLTLKQIGLHSYTVCDVRGDHAPEFAMGCKMTERNILFRVAVNGEEHASLMRAVSQFEQQGQSVTLFPSEHAASTPAGSG
ncbi:hypothetical protein [Thiomicrorhabdus sp.]|uniref:hypothetical protein n=1 Tax=Thiomicrorhabdus sp. TaxID=2039724 RepID=UPI0029C6B688|nr:hypothetical protein [Thiomicrorhabdus sp.]